MVYYRFCAIIGKISKKTPLIIVAAQKKPKLLILRKIITDQKPLPDTATEEVSRFISKPVQTMLFHSSLGIRYR